jgi:sugar phosphate isomerase/epimerase
MTRLRLGYNTNGFAHHRLPDAVAILARLGYDGIALTLDWHHLDPLTVSPERVRDLRRLLADAGLAVVVETGARYLLDPWHKHEPTLVSPSGRERRLEFLHRAIDVAAALDAEAVSFFSGRLADGVDRASARTWLVDGCRDLAKHAHGAGVALALEPEPGMLVETLGAAADVLREVNGPSLGLAMDIGHVRCSETFSEVEAIEAYAPQTRTVHIEDIAGREHSHLMFGAGDLAFEPILAALERVHFAGLVSVELSRDSHRAPEAAAASIAFLRTRMKPEP